MSQNITLKRLPALIKAQGVENPDAVLTELSKHLREELGDNFERIEPGDLAAIRTKYYPPAGGATAGAGKVLDVLIKNMTGGADASVAALRTSRTPLESRTPTSQGGASAGTSSPSVTGTISAARELLSRLAGKQPEPKRSGPIVPFDYVSDPRQATDERHRVEPLCVSPSAQFMAIAKTESPYVIVAPFRQDGDDVNVNCDAPVKVARFAQDGGLFMVDTAGKLSLFEWDREGSRNNLTQNLLPGVKVLDMAVSRDGSRILVACSDDQLRILDVEAREWLPLDFDYHFTEASTLSVEGDTVVCTDATGVYSWDSRSEKGLTLAREANGGTNTTSPAPALLSPDGRRMAQACGGVIRVWDLPSRAGGAPRELGSVRESPVKCIEFSADSRTLFAADEAGRITRFDLATMKPIGNPIEYGQPIARLAVSRDGRFLSVVGVSTDEGRQSNFEFSPLLETVKAEPVSTFRRLVADHEPIVFRTPSGQYLPLACADGKLIESGDLVLYKDDSLAESAVGARWCLVGKPGGAFDETALAMDPLLRKGFDLSRAVEQGIGEFCRALDPGRVHPANNPDLTVIKREVKNACRDTRALIEQFEVAVGEWKAEAQEFTKREMTREQRSFAEAAIAGATPAMRPDRGITLQDAKAMIAIADAIYDRPEILSVFLGRNGVRIQVDVETQVQSGGTMVGYEKALTDLLAKSGITQGYEICRDYGLEGPSGPWQYVEKSILAPVVGEDNLRGCYVTYDPSTQAEKAVAFHVTPETLEKARAQLATIQALVARYDLPSPVEISFAGADAWG